MTDKQTDELTGYPSIDKPWLKYFDKELLEEPIPKCTIYQSIYQNNKDYPQDFAINFLATRLVMRRCFPMLIYVRNLYARLG